MASFWYITVITIDVITNSQNYVNASMHFSVYYYYYYYYYYFLWHIIHIIVYILSWSQWYVSHFLI